MKSTAVFAFVAMVLAASAELTVGDIEIRQDRPWSTRTYVSFSLSGLESDMAKFTVKAYQGDTSLGEIPDHLLSGDVYADANGSKQISFDPEKVDFLKAKGKLADFKVGISANAHSNILYKVIDLRYEPGTEGQLTYITDADLHSGSKRVIIPGSSSYVTWDLSCATNFVAGVESLIWTGVVDNARFRNSHLVMRRVKGGTFNLGQGALQRTATLDDFWIGVYAFTAGNYKLVVDETTWSQLSQDVTGSLTYPMRTISYGAIRGTGKIWPEDGNQVDANSLVGLMRTWTGVESFDLPTEAQWEYACRAGTSTTYYNNSDDSSTLGEIAQYSANSSGNVKQNGCKAPNALGLYDMIGNQWEFVRDWYSTDSSKLDSGTEPVGPPSEGSTYRTVRGGSCKSGAGNCTSYSRTSDSNTLPNAETVGAIYGFRLIQKGW